MAREVKVEYETEPSKKDLDFDLDLDGAKIQKDYGQNEKVMNKMY